MTIQYGACCISKATDKLSEYVIPIASLRQRPSVLRYAYIACLVVLSYETHIYGVRGIVESMCVSVFVVEYCHNCDLL